MNKFKKLRFSGPAVDVGKLFTKETRSIEQVVLEIWFTQIRVLILCLFVF
jgi:hypothetical protein